ncbi:hypothetical protein APHWI1_0196 [Anaplasma phagocytophilum str. ApWI1]|uniref:Uncharacterized protein n=2 Tax=Anaplasma phagocytophilum TaxID=948 RepID=A0A0F3N4W6_ANAPH|nr:hypothetical protein APHWEB_1318 [Anaplasma phagocytophilum str. Webster]KJV63100.1 hypothetical protein EPHNCH_1007 [Anaplasma phagocytophilum str. NCH-1]KJV83232.1 hypothetical protein APHHGE2_0994 [Anaplasma phagocytophilum str. HGE2]KJV84097.1 hypothetical protein APHWI1_0196 [Anaplasma phagocytophilum str. ApWI1]KJV87439.1 hypothetical protein APHNYW_0705 [Anaplasma phagocytophilum str. ApNYW]KJV98820.1 hypothetical protein OTSANNIE_0966 [Anaplasma phagocytophilum str. Annie]KJZ98039.
MCIRLDSKTSQALLMIMDRGVIFSCFEKAANLNCLFFI